MAMFEQGSWLLLLDNKSRRCLTANSQYRERQTVTDSRSHENRIRKVRLQALALLTEQRFPAVKWPCLFLLFMSSYTMGE